ncbi:MAG: hypothetical protein MI757_14490, partial [Pirellulales bacterium]|nr:hypothetical protein [Pirellulales bacterium]
VSAMARNLGLVVRRLFGFGTARSLQREGNLADALHFAWLAIERIVSRLLAAPNRTHPHRIKSKIATCSTGC